MVTIVRATCLVVAMLSLTTVAAAQPGVAGQDAPSQAVDRSLVQTVDDDRGAVTDRKPLVVTLGARTAAPSSALRRQSGSLPRRRDTLWNGVIIGAGVGAMAGAVGGNALLDCSECAGFNVPLTFGLIGAGAGAGIGAGIDALRHTRSLIPGTHLPVTVTPVLGRGQRAVVALVRF